MADLTGRCACGAATWRSTGPVLWAGHCHCDSCRRATAAPFTSFLGVSPDSVHITGPLTERRGSAGRVQRRHCPTCGTQITYTADDWPGEVHFYAATLDDPAAFVPQAHYHYGERLPWIEIADDLPRHVAAAPPVHQAEQTSNTTHSKGHAQ